MTTVHQNSFGLPILSRRNVVIGGAGAVARCQPAWRGVCRDVSTR
jgi:hypothetical protein